MPWKYQKCRACKTEYHDKIEIDSCPICRATNIIRKGHIPGPYVRKTIDEYNIQGYYSQGWETVTCEETRQAAKDQVKCYRENEPGIAFRIKKQRVKIESEQ